MPLDPNQLKRRAVILAGHTGDAATAHHNMHHRDPHVRAATLGALHRLGTLSVAALQEALADNSATVRCRAVALSIHYPNVSPSPLLADTEDTVIETAAWACGERSKAEYAAVPKLCELCVEHPNPLVREAAVAALGAIGHPDGLEAILAATADRVAVRRRAVLALAPFEGNDVDNALSRALNDRDWQTRDAAELLTQVDPA